MEGRWVIVSEKSRSKFWEFQIFSHGLLWWVMRLKTSHVILWILFLYAQAQIVKEIYSFICFSPSTTLEAYGFVLKLSHIHSYLLGNSIAPRREMFKFTIVLIKVYGLSYNTSRIAKQAHGHLSISFMNYHWEMYISYLQSKSSQFAAAISKNLFFENFCQFEIHKR